MSNVASTSNSFKDKSRFNLTCLIIYRLFTMAPAVGYTDHLNLCKTPRIPQKPAVCMGMIPWGKHDEY